MERKTRNIGDGNFISAVTTAIRDLRAGGGAELNPVSKDFRLDGKTCLVTGANSGLGKAVAADLARRGGKLIVACRPGHASIRDEIRRMSGSDAVEMMAVDLADLASVHRFCDRLAERGIRIDIAVMNAGLMTRHAKKSAQGFEMMFAVHFLANRVMVDRWLGDGIIQLGNQTGAVPRIVFISSESHRSSDGIDFETPGAFTEFGIRECMRYYGLSKLALCTYATELSRRLNPDVRVDCAVHSMCPGGVATNIARDAPKWLRPLVVPVLRRFFQSPAEAAKPVIYLCCTEEAGGSTGLYLHMMRRKSVSPQAADPENGARLWRASEPMLVRPGE
ncbi:MAG: SDR family NAD(P)-dependent oxidoreductase [Halieaceae bacterium]|nr:SDR family NAD(P)-dependent oxidoreductase [Halieaceae bacterium]